jgi:hypothetical protein
MHPDQSTWRHYLDAVERKLQIAQFHKERLSAELGCLREARGFDDLPPITVQAHFEGVVTALMGAVDKVAEAAHKVAKLTGRLGEGKKKWHNSELLERGLPFIGNLVPAIETWRNQPLLADMREVRRRAIHHVSTKRATPEWAIESVGPGYNQSRELSNYAKACVNLGEQLRKLMPEICIAFERLIEQFRTKAMG